MGGKRTAVWIFSEAAEPQELDTIFPGGSGGIPPLIQWTFQEPKSEVPTIYKAYFPGLWFREYVHKIWPNVWY